MTSAAAPPASTSAALRLGWILLSPPTQPQPSTRIAGLHMMEDLAQHGIVSDILFAPQQATEQPQLPEPAQMLEQIRARGIDVVIFQKTHGESVRRLAAALQQAGVKSLFLVCDLILPELSVLTDATVVVTDYLRSLYPAELHHKLRVVHDGIERIELHKQDYGRQTGSAREALKATLVTSAPLRSLAAMGLPPAWLRLRILGQYPPGHGRFRRSLEVLRRWRRPGPDHHADLLAFAAHPRISTEAWSESAAYEALLDADIGVIPVDTRPTSPPGALPPNWMRKSENRLTLKMALGLPVIASPVPAYLDIIEHGVNGFIADSPQAWRDSLQALRDPELRERMGRVARQSVVERYSRARQAEAFLQVLQELTAGRPGPQISRKPE